MYMNFLWRSMILHIMIIIPTKILELNFPGKMDLPNLCSSETYIYISVVCVDLGYFQ